MTSYPTIFEKFRRCPICNELLQLDHALKYNINLDISNDALRKIWNDDRVAIPCCGCNQIMHEITGTGDSKILKTMPSAWKEKRTLIYNNLKKFGII